MSTILKALRRLEEERSGARAAAPRPTLRKAGEARSWRGPAAAGLAGVALVAFFVWTLGPWRAKGPDEAPSETAAAERRELARAVPQAAPRAPAPRTLPEPAALDPTLPVPTPPDPARDAALPLPSPSLASARAAAAVPEPPPAPRSLERSALEPPRAASTARPPPAPAPTPAEPPTVARPKPPPRPAVKARRESPAPALRAVPRAVPDVRVESTTWHPDPARRLVVLRVAGRAAPLRLHEGDAVGPLVVLEIEPAAVVFANGEVELRRRVGGP